MWLIFDQFAAFSATTEHVSRFYEVSRQEQEVSECIPFEQKTDPSSANTHSERSVYKLSSLTILEIL